MTTPAYTITKRGRSDTKGTHHATLDSVMQRIAFLWADSGKPHPSKDFRHMSYAELYSHADDLGYKLSEYRPPRWDGLPDGMLVPFKPVDENYMPVYFRGGDTTLEGWVEHELHERGLDELASRHNLNMGDKITMLGLKYLIPDKLHWVGRVIYVMDKELASDHPDVQFMQRLMSALNTLVFSDDNPIEDMEVLEEYGLLGTVLMPE